ncbi:MAG: peptidylprolyl isomerase [Pseudomonadales bacterium]|nr:peptidylprolyl isomerase [Pseudomonadales bacterium]
MKPWFVTNTLRLCITRLIWAALALSAGQAAVAEQGRQDAARVFSENPRVLIETTQGNIELELLPKFAPKHVNNFLDLLEQEFYSGLIFHRVIPNFMIQAGGYEVGVKYREHSDKMVPNESYNGLKNKRFSVAAARTDDPDSADTQFYINVVDNPFLDAQPNKPGYTVFGRVIDGFDAVERIELTDTHLRKGMAGVPEQPIVISAVKLLNPQ